MVNFICANCGYKFKSAEEDTKTCPYCDKKALESEKSASELLDEIGLAG